MEIVKNGHKQVWNFRSGRLVLKKFLFDKLKVFRDVEGNVTGEMPFSETVYLISQLGKDGGKSIWLSETEWSALKEGIEECEESFLCSAGMSRTSGSARRSVEEQLKIEQAVLEVQGGGRE